MSRPYSIGFLNDLHEHFPDLLYRPQRFRTVADILNYIIEIANQNPYQHALSSYRIRDTSPLRAPRVSIDDEKVAELPAIRISNGVYRILEDVPERPSLLRMPPLEPIENPAEHVLQRFLQELIGPPSASVWDPVVVRPTEAQREAASVLTTLNPAPSEACAICQEMMENGQTVRVLRHCIHRFHKECIDTWFQQHVTCPTCRHDIREP